MKWNTKGGRGALSAVTAGALVLSLAACDQIQSLWKSEDKTNPATGPLVQTPQPEAKIEVVQKAVEIPKAPKIDEDAALATQGQSSRGSALALKFRAIDAGASGGVVTLYGTANNRALREKAAQVASKVEGVKSVRNELVIVAGS